MFSLLSHVALPALLWGWTLSCLPPAWMPYGMSVLPPLLPHSPPPPHPPPPPPARPSVLGSHFIPQGPGPAVRMPAPSIPVLTPVLKFIGLKKVLVPSLQGGLLVFCFNALTPLVLAPRDCSGHPCTLPVFPALHSAGAQIPRHQSEG